jgi:hypothetical protein
MDSVLYYNTITSNSTKVIKIMKPKYIVYMRTWWIFHKQFVACDDIRCVLEDDVVLCIINDKVIAILDKKLFKYAKEINF